MRSFTELTGAFEEKFLSTLPFPQLPETLYAPCRYLLQLGGKRVRPVLCLMANELMGDICNDAWYAAAAIELFHNFTLIHDDIMDKAPLRRGFATIHEKYGMTSGILSGDVMSIFAYQQLAHINQPLAPILHLFNKTAIEVCEGQQYDMDFEQRDDVSIDEYMHMITLKTSVLLACSLKMGGMLGGATDGTTDMLYSFGKNLGIAFQLQDDHLDAFGDTGKSGKQNGGDIKANKKTFLLLKAMENATPAQKQEIEHLIKHDHNEKVGRMLDLYTATKADIQCRQAVKYYSDLAFKCLEDVAAPNKRKEQLHNLASYLLDREQ